MLGNVTCDKQSSPDVLAHIDFGLTDRMTNDVLQRPDTFGGLGEIDGSDRVHQRGIEQGIAKPISLLADRQRMSAKLDCDEIQGLDLPCPGLLSSGRSGCFAPHAALDDGLLLAGNEDGGDVGDALVFGHGFAVGGDLDEVLLPDLVDEVQEDVVEGRGIEGRVRR